MPDPVLVRFDHWPDPVLDQIGFHARSEYVERVWGSVLGPTGTLCLRECALLLETAGESVTVDLAEFAQRLGLAPHTGSNSTICRTLVRLDHFDFAVALPGGYAVRTWVPPVGRKRIARAPRIVQELHEFYVAARAPSAEAS